MVVPIYNDGSLAEKFCIEFETVFIKYLNKKKVEKDIELIFVNDGSLNDSWDKLTKLLKKFKFVKLINLSRNFGQHIALSCGYKHASGDYVGMMNVDMQEHPDQIPVAIEYLIKNDCDIVTAIRTKRNDSRLSILSSYLFNYFLNKFTGYNQPLNVGTLRIMNRKFVTAYNELSEKSRYLPGLENWLGFKHGYVEIVHNKRSSGKSSYNFRKRLSLAINSILSFSDIPLKFFIYLGMIISLIGFSSITVLVVKKFFYTDIMPGYTSTLSALIFLSGVQIIISGVLGLYVGKILKEVQNRPLYVIKEVHRL
jgi:dolichol-phosphate mannosyltransferase